MLLRLALTREGDLLQVAQYSPFCVPGLLKMLLRLALTRGNDLLQVAHQEACWMYEESASVLWMAGSPAAQEGTISPAHPLSAQLDRQMLARLLAYFVGTFLVLVPPLAHPLPLQTVVPGHTSERESVVLLVLHPTLVRLIWSESQPSGHHLQIQLP